MADALPSQFATEVSRSARPWFRRYPVATLLCALMLMFATIPLQEHLPDGDLVESVTLTLMLLSALLAVGARRRTLIAGFCLVTPALVGKWVNHFHPDAVPFIIVLGAAASFLILIVFILLHFILRATRIDSEVLCAAVATYLLFGLGWAIGYGLIARLDASAFAVTSGPAPAQWMRGFTSLYFSFITLSTVGYGDIVPVSKTARMLAMLEAITGTIYVAVLISRLVSLYSSNPPKPPDPPPPAV